MISSAWSDDEIDRHIPISANATATIHAPISKPAVVQEGGKLADAINGVSFLCYEAGISVYKIESSKYHFHNTL